MKHTLTHTPKRISQARRVFRTRNWIDSCEQVLAGGDQATLLIALCVLNILM